MSDLLHFINDLIEENDGVVEWAPDGKAFQARLPADLRRGLGLSESLVNISDNIHGNEKNKSVTIPIGYGTKLLDRAIPIALEMGQTAAVYMPYFASRQKPDVDVGDYFSFPNAAFKEKGSHVRDLDYWLWSFEVTADAHERYGEIHHTCISKNGVECPDLPALIQDQASSWKPLPFKSWHLSPNRLDTLFVAACDRTLRRIQENLSDFKLTVARHHARDIKRIEIYFNALRREIADELKRGNLKEGALAIRKENIHRLWAEESAKLAALKDKYRVRLAIRPMALLLARLPVSRHELLIKRRKSERRISLVYNRLSRAFDPMRCEACGVDTYSPGFCDDSLHLLCASCFSVFARQKECPRCGGKVPPSGLSEVLGRHGIQAYGESENE